MERPPRSESRPDAARRARPLTGLAGPELAERVLAAGGKAFQARQIEEWIHRRAALDYAEFRNLPRALLDALRSIGPVAGSEVVTAETSEDGTEKLLLRLADGNTVEEVIIPEGDRTTLCVSTQVGCPVACVFCASGLFGVERNLTVDEIVEQVLHARARLPADRRLTNLVVMGMGEPMLNLDHLLPALRRITDPDGFDFGARRITVSTSGYPERIDRFAAESGPHQLAISLHAADDDLRRRLVPTATAPVAELVGAARRYFDRKGREVTFEVVLLAGVNDRAEDARAMVQVLRGFPATVNLIPWNAVEEIRGLASPAPARTEAFASWLRQGGLNVTVRRRRGADRSAACGQLRIRAAAPAPAVAAPRAQGSDGGSSSAIGSG